jgi:hypothetical protein
MTKLFIAWVKKKLCIQSPSTTCLGYKYEYDYLSKEPILQAYKMAIKALDQEDAIEKIRAEVESINAWSLRYAPTHDGNIRPQIVSNVKEHVLEIIDKYKEDT